MRASNRQKRPHPAAPVQDRPGPSRFLGRDSVNQRMAIPYIPTKDADFDAWIVNFSALLTADPTDFGLLAGDATAVAAVTLAWTTAYPLAIDPGTRTPATVAAKDAARASATATVRPYAIRIRNNDSVSNELKVSIGVTVPNTPPTPIPAPIVAPSIAIVKAIPLQMTLAYSTAEVDGKAKPFGVVGVEVWRVVGTVPAVDPLQTGYKATVTKSPFRQTFEAGEQGKVCTFFARYVTRSGPGGVSQVGPWSAALSVIVM